MPNSKELRIGVFVPSGVQLLDLSPIDLFGMLSTEYLRVCQLPAPIVNLGTPSTIHYISMPNSGTHIELTASASLKISKTTEDKEVQPGLLDIILVPGPDPSVIFDAKVLDFVRAHAGWQGSDGKRTDILSVCTGCILLGQGGILKGKKASGPRGIVPKLQKQFPDTTWVDDKRWVKDGNIWTSGKQTSSTIHCRWNFRTLRCSMPLSSKGKADKKQAGSPMGKKW
jgi:putative intracellular protease/amidase